MGFTASNQQVLEIQANSNVIPLDQEVQPINKAYKTKPKTHHP